MKLLRRGEAFFMQRRINREVAEGLEVQEGWRKAGYSDAEIRDLWLLTSGVKPEDWPHDHDEGA